MRLDTSLPVVIGIVLAVGAGCRKHEPPATPVARVDQETLTLEQVIGEFDTTQGVSQAQVYSYVQQWLTSELLYREAIRRGLDRRADIDEKLKGMRRQLAINALLDQEVYALMADSLGDDDVRLYYEANRDQFILANDAALLSLVLFSKREAANAFRAIVVRSMPWGEALEQTRQDSAASATLLASLDSAYFTEATLVPGELWRVAAGVSRQEPSFPVRTADGYYVVMVWKLSRKGEPADLDYVADEIENRLLIDRRQARYREFLANLRARHDIQVLISQERTDSLRLVPGAY